LRKPITITKQEVAQVVEHLLASEALSSNPDTKKKKHTKTTHWKQQSRSFGDFSQARRKWKFRKQNSWGYDSNKSPQPQSPLFLLVV
jgi:hypothetical protein